MQELKGKLISEPIPGYPNNRAENTLTTDASLTGKGATLTQKQETVNRGIASANKTLNKRKYSATKRELFEEVHFTNHSETYQLGRKILIVKNHQKLFSL